jgi:hypothetical protein
VIIRCNVSPSMGGRSGTLRPRNTLSKGRILQGKTFGNQLIIPKFMRSQVSQCWQRDAEGSGPVCLAQGEIGFALAFAQLSQSNENTTPRFFKLSALRVFYFDKRLEFICFTLKHCKKVFKDLFTTKNDFRRRAAFCPPCLIVIANKRTTSWSTKHVCVSNLAW